MALTRKLYSGSDYRRALSIAELRGLARRRIPHFAFEYVECGAEDEVTLRHNRAVGQLGCTTLPELGPHLLVRDEPYLRRVDDALPAGR